MLPFRDRGGSLDESLGHRCEGPEERLVYRYFQSRGFSHVPVRELASDAGAGRKLYAVNLWEFPLPHGHCYYPDALVRGPGPSGMLHFFEVKRNGSLKSKYRNFKKIYDGIEELKFSGLPEDRQHDAARKHVTTRLEIDLRHYDTKQMADFERVVQGVIAFKHYFGDAPVRFHAITSAHLDASLHVDLTMPYGRRDGKLVTLAKRNPEMADELLMRLFEITPESLAAEAEARAARAAAARWRLLSRRPRG